MIPSTKEMLEIGDVVDYKPQVWGRLVETFVKDYGYGPFVIRSFDGSDTVHCNTLGGEPVKKNPSTLWRHGVGNLVRNEFLTAVRRAKHGI